MRSDPEAVHRALVRAEWIATFVDCLMRVSPDDDAAGALLLGEASWEAASHREPVNVVQDILIARHLAVQRTEN